MTSFTPPENRYENVFNRVHRKVSANTKLNIVNKHKKSFLMYCKKTS